MQEINIKYSVLAARSYLISEEEGLKNKIREILQKLEEHNEDHFLYTAGWTYKKLL